MAYFMSGPGGPIEQAAAGYGGWGFGAVAGGGGGKAYIENGVVKWVVSGSGETVSSIAQKVYGSAQAWPKICAYNDSIGVKRDPQTPPGDCWYKVGTIITLPKIAGFPDPATTVTTSGLPVAQPGDTIVNEKGETVTVGSGGVAKAGLGTGAMIGLAVAAVAVVGGLALLGKKKPEGAQSRGPSSSRAMTRATANWR